MIKTVILSGEEERVKGLGGQNTVIVNFGSAALYASVKPDIVPDGDDVVTIFPGNATNLYDTNGTVYLLGTGKVQLEGTNYNTIPVTGSGSAGGGGDILDNIIFNGLSEALPKFERLGFNYTIPYKTLNNGKDVCLDYYKSFSMFDPLGDYTDANIITSEKTFPLSRYDKIAITAIPYKNHSMTGSAYFKAGIAEPSQPHSQYDFSGWTHICDITRITENYDAPGDPITFEINILDIGEDCPISLGLTHGNEVSGFTTYFYVLKIEFLK